MSETLTEIESESLDTAEGAFEAFCEDVSGMFGLTAEGEGSQIPSLKVSDLKKDFKKLTAIYTVESKGAVNGTFYIVLNQNALFTLAGTFVMLPEKMLVQYCKAGTEKEAQEIEDAVGEVGNLLIGAWDKFFREQMDGHEHFLQTGTYIGKPWLKPEETIGLAKDEELSCVKFEMTIEPFDPFVCSAVFPKSVFGDAVTDQAEPGDAEEKPAEEPAAKEPVAEEPAAEEPAAEKTEEVKEEPAAEKPVAEEPAAEKTEEVKEEPAAEKPVAEEPAAEKTEEVKEEPAAEEPVAEEPAAEKTEEVKEEPAAEEPVAEEPAAEKTEEVKEEPAAEEPVAEEPAAEKTEEPATQEPAPEDRPVSKVIEKMTKSPAALPGELNSQILTDITAENVMRTDLLWATQDDTVETVLANMQQYNIGYALIGTPAAIEGIVSKSDIKGALSPYLQSIFSKWKREIDTATLQIKVRWIMSRPVHTIRPDARLASVMETMSSHSIRALPVADENGVCGIVTAFSIFNVLVAANSSEDIPAEQNTDVPALS